MVDMLHLAVIDMKPQDLASMSGMFWVKTDVLHLLHNSRHVTGPPNTQNCRGHLDGQTYPERRPGYSQHLFGFYRRLNSQVNKKSTWQLCK